MTSHKRLKGESWEVYPTRAATRRQRRQAWKALGRKRPNWQYLSAMVPSALLNHPLDLGRNQEKRKRRLRSLLRKYKNICLSKLARRWTKAMGRIEK